MRRGGFHDALENLRYLKYRTIVDVRNASAKFVEPMDYLQRPLTPSRTNLNDWRGNLFARLVGCFARRSIKSFRLNS